MILGKHCPMCNCWGRRLFQVQGYWIRECQTCSHRWAEIGSPEGHTKRVYGDSYFEGGGAGYPGYTELGQLLIEHGRRYGRLVAKYVQPGNVLEVGSAAGFILKGMIESGWSGIGIEPNDTMAAYARSELGLQVKTTSLEEITTDSRFDLISMVQVLPHLFDLRRALTRAAELTQPDGLWLIETWDRSSWFARIWGRHWHEYSPPSVLHFLTRRSVQQFAAEHGFVEIANGRPRKFLLGTHAKSLLHFQFGDSLRGRLLKPVIATIPKNARIPYPSWDLFWSLFRRR